MISTIVTSKISLEDWMQNPPKLMEWVDGQLVEKNGITLKHGRIQAKLGSYWRNYKDTSRQGGEVYTKAPCRTNKQGRLPDVAYLTLELLVQYGNSNALPQSFPLFAEIISPTDKAEEIFSKAKEYLQSGCQEVWLVLPESEWIIIITQQQRILFTTGEVVTTQNVLQGFGVALDELLT